MGLFVLTLCMFGVGTGVGCGEVVLAPMARVDRLGLTGHKSAEAVVHPGWPPMCGGPGGLNRAGRPCSATRFCYGQPCFTLAGAVFQLLGMNVTT